MATIALSFSKQGDVLVGDKALPLDKTIPVVMQVQSGGNGPSVRKRFNLNMGSCPSCDYREYGCHGEEAEEHGHGHPQ